MKKLLLTILVFNALSIFSQNGIIRGKVVNLISNEPLPFATIKILNTELGAIADENGEYKIENLNSKLYNIEAAAIGFKSSIKYEMQVTNAIPLELDFRLEENLKDLGEVIVKADAFRKTEESPLSLRNIGVNEIARNPGGNRDISKVIQSLPGVTTGVSFRNDLIIRGGAPNENRFYLDDVEVPNINHFATQGASGGPVGMINVNFINEVDFYSGAFPANKGNSLSSVFNFKQKDGRKDKIGVNFTLGASDAGLTLDGPLGDKTTFLLSARRSYLQFLFKALKLPFLPTYNDFQVKVKHKFNDKNEITFIGLGAIDKFVLNKEANETEQQKYQLSYIPETPQWNYTNGIVYKNYGKNGFWTFVLSRNMLNNESIKYLNNEDTDPSKLILKYKSQEIENKLRIERNERFGTYKLIYGIGYEYVKYNNSTYNKINVLNDPIVVNYASSFAASKYYGFAQLSKSFLNEKLTLSGGLRVEGLSIGKKMQNPLDQFSPRLSATYKITDKLSWNFNTGIYYQLPPYTTIGFKENGNFVNLDQLTFIKSDHIVSGFEFRARNTTKFTVEAYYKNYSNYPFLTRKQLSLANLGGDFGVIGNEPATSTSNGRSYGIEFFAQQKLINGFYGIFAYTYGRSEFEDITGKQIPSSWDSKHIVSTTLGKQLARNWEIGLKWRFQSGLPFTPEATNSNIVAIWDLNGRAYKDYNQLNSIRLLPNSVIDIRVDKKWFFKKFNLNVYMDIQNFLNNKSKNPQVVLDQLLDTKGNPTGTPQTYFDTTDNTLRYRVKTINNSVGNVLPSVGLIIEY
jgi:CarboxypepD_reg-like domain/TonB-dependent Receptor Plug Domain